MPADYEWSFERSEDLSLRQDASLAPGVSERGEDGLVNADTTPGEGELITQPQEWEYDDMELDLDSTSEPCVGGAINEQVVAPVRMVSESEVAIMLEQVKEESGEAEEDNMEPDLDEAEGGDPQGSVVGMSDDKEVTSPSAGDMPAQQPRLVEISGDIRIMTLNVRGLGPTLPHKVEALKQLLHDLRISVAVITESHLNEVGMKRLVLPGFETKCRDCREDSAHGGVFIAVRLGVAHKVLPKDERPSLHINACSLLLYPTGEEDYALKVTGVYLPPPPTLTVEPHMLSFLTDLEQQEVYQTGGNISHLIVGDFNQHSWKGGNDSLYHEWIAETGMWELSDPAKATHQQGSALDKYLLLPGRDIPENLLPWGVDQGDEVIEDLSEEYYPAYTFPFRCIADHHPVLLTIPGKEEQKRPVQKQLKIKQLTPEEWEGRNERMQGYIT